VFWEHSHNHSHSGHSQRHSTEQAIAARAIQSRHDPEHDADAIYLPCGTLSVAVKDQRPASSVDPIRAAVPSSDATCILAAQANSSAPHHPPDDLRPGAKLFLTLRNLRI
jgi:hypothetical protein